MISLLEQDFCVVDTETTGGSAVYDRVIDVAVYHWRDGVIHEKFETLVNPGCPIPPWITTLTGIDDAMVARAPAFRDIAEPLAGILTKGVFTAHNAGFDYGFIREEFARLGAEFERPQLCTVRLARLLFPELPSRSLGILCEHLLIDIWNRHRASGDAEATVYALKHMLKKVKQECGIETWEDLQSFVACGLLALPEGLAYSTVHTLPESAGRIILKDAAGETIFEGKTANVRQRIKNLFRKSNQSKRSNRFRDVVRGIEFVGS